MTKGSQNGYWATEPKIWVRKWKDSCWFFFFWTSCINKVMISRPMHLWTTKYKIWASNWELQIPNDKNVTFWIVGTKKVGNFIVSPCWKTTNPTQNYHQTQCYKFQFQVLRKKKLFYLFLEGYELQNFLLLECNHKWK